MPPQSFTIDEVWQKLHVLEGQIIPTLVHKRRNKIIRFLPEGMLRQTEEKGGGWRDAKLVPKSVFRNMWSRLSSHGYSSADQGEYAIAAACLVRVAELGVDLVKNKSPRTIVLRHREAAAHNNSETITHDEDAEEFGDLERIVMDSDICSGKPTIKGTRIMVSNILGMFSGGYSINRILRAYPELSRLDVISAVEYASWVVDREKMVARS